MNLLLDTHILLWFLNDDPQLSPAASAVIVDPANRKLVSVATCWEIAIKVGLKKLDLGEPATTFLPRELAANGFDLLGIELEPLCDSPTQRVRPHRVTWPPPLFNRTGDRT